MQKNKEMGKQEDPKEQEARKEKEAEKQQKPLVYDCGSSLYDSFELKSFERQLYSAINSRTLSMPHLSDRRVLPPPAIHPKKSPSKISRSFHKLLRSVFKPKHQSVARDLLFEEEEKAYNKDGFYLGLFEFDKPNTMALSTILEAPELGGFSPENRYPTRRTASYRFTASSVGISCA